MPTAVFVLQTGSPAAQLGWASLFAAAADDELVVFYADPPGGQLSTGKSSPPFVVEEVATSGVAKQLPLGERALMAPITQAVRLDSRDLAQAVQSAVEELAVSCLLIPRDRGERVDEEAFRDRREILQRVSCMVVQLCPGLTQADQCERILVGAGPGEATDDALQWAARIAKRIDGQAHAVYIERDSSDLAMHVARRAIKRLVADSVKQFPDRVDATVIINKDVAAGLRQAAAGHQLVLLGASHHNVLHRWLFSSISEKLMGDHEGPTVAMVRPALTWSSRVSQAVARIVADTIPQLDRTKRLNLFERIQGASQWNFDFAALISLSTLIATLGLLQDSAAVVIGAMLVAPLMTPLLGIGLAITQGNSTLGRTSTRTVALGFICSYVMGWITASCVPGVVITGEVAARGSPRSDGPAGRLSQRRCRGLRHWTSQPALGPAGSGDRRRLGPAGCLFGHWFIATTVGTCLGRLPAVPDQHRGDRAGRRLQFLAFRHSGAALARRPGSLVATRRDGPAGGRAGTGDL